MRFGPGAQETLALPQINVTAPRARSAAPPQAAGRAVAVPAAPAAIPLLGTLPVVTDQFATVTVVPNEEIRRNGGGTLGDLLFSKPGITGSSFAPGASSRPIIRGLDMQPRPHPGERHRRQRRLRPRRGSRRADRSAGDASRSR